MVQFRGAGFLLGEVMPDLGDVPAGVVERHRAAHADSVRAGPGGARPPLIGLVLRFPGRQGQLFPEQVQGDLRGGEQGVYPRHAVAGACQHDKLGALHSDVPQPGFDLLVDLRQDGMIVPARVGAAAGGRADASPTQAPAVLTAGWLDNRRTVRTFPERTQPFSPGKSDEG